MPTSERRYTMCKFAYGSRRWYAVPVGAEQHGGNAVFFCTGTASYEVDGGARIQYSDGAKFFERKRDLLRAIQTVSTS